MIYFKNWLHRAVKSAFVKSALTLASGTIIAQLLALMAMPLLTRLYSPGDFSLLAIYMSISSIVSVVACLRFDIAIALPSCDREAVSLLVISLMLSLLTSLAALSIFTIWSFEIEDILNSRGLIEYFWLIPLTIFFASSYSALRYWSGRKLKFKSIAVNQIVQVGGGAGTQSISGLIGLTPAGLLFGHMVYSALGVIGLGFRTAGEIKNQVKKIKLQDLAKAAAAYKKFPQYSTFEALLNTAAIELPLILIAALVAGPEVGFLMLVMRIMGAPLQLVGQAVGQVYLAKAADAHRKKILKELTLTVVGGLAKVGAIPILLLSVVAPQGFAIVFGEEWFRAGELAMWLAPWFILQLLVSPVSMALHVIGRQYIALYLQFFGAVVRIGSVLLAAELLQGSVPEVYAVSGALFYAIYLFVVLHQVIKSER